MTWEEQVQWVMKNTDVEWENLYIVEEIAKETTPTTVVVISDGIETITTYLSLGRNPGGENFSNYKDDKRNWTSI